jgi:hypothetical protein
MHGAIEPYAEAKRSDHEHEDGSTDKIISRGRSLRGTEDVYVRLAFINRYNSAEQAYLVSETYAGVTMSV